MDTETWERKISDIIERCEVYWVISEVSRPRIEEMKLELQQHLRDAGRDGKPPEAVVGEDVEVFAEAWAKESRTSKGPGELLLNFSSTTVTCTVYLLVTRHVLEWTPVFPLDLWTLVAALLLTTMIWALMSKTLAPKVLFGPWWHMLLAGFGVGSLVLGLGLVWSLTESTPLNPELITWPWPATLVLAVVALALNWFWRDPTAPARRTGTRW